MIRIYSKHTKKYYEIIEWMLEHQLVFEIRKITSKSSLTKNEIFELLKLTENGFDDLLNKKSKKYLEIENKIDAYSVNQMIEKIILYPSLIKFPIIVDNNKLMIGFNKKKIRIFLPEEYRRNQLEQYLISFDSKL
ncbi:ArsC/Spx/MgsR family protein [Enterococcus durans]|uniref:ArsC/Spx/MgsR family protein n=1 Tax=Enterococcus durans TaxID=53345 RepID=UPI0039A707BE